MPLQVVLVHGQGRGDDPALPRAVAALSETGEAEVALWDGGAAGPLRGDAAIVVDGEAGASAAPALRAFAAAGGAVLGLGGGFSALCAAGLLPGAVVLESAGQGGRAADHVRVEGRATPFTWAIPAGRVVRLPAGAAGGARYVADDAPALESAGRVLLRYCDAAGGVEEDAVAGVCDAGARVLGMLPAAADAVALLADGLGRQLLASLRLAARAPRRRAP